MFELELISGEDISELVCSMKAGKGLEDELDILKLFERKPKRLYRERTARPVAPRRDGPRPAPAGGAAGAVGAPAGA